jgi:pimeloyl-ACP methyl ester carboxylesterase
MRQAIFIPGLLCTGELFAPQIEALAGKLGIAVGDHTRHATMQAIAAHILKSAPERFVLAGLSMGGYIAFEIMRQAGERVEALILLDTGPHADTAEQTERRRTLLALAEADGIEPVIDQLLPLFIAEDRLGDADLVGTIRKMATETGPETFSRQQAAIMARPDSVPTLSQIACPTMVVVGDRDSLTPPALAREIAGGIAGARLEIIPGSGHISTLEKPDAVNTAITKFLEEAGFVR